ncbi:MAG: 30S ribosomal protein S18 [Candidatus Nealsonbacteria bacterium]|nr:30S ribosomal protein S18 [Candidatus Nealsonbacteria bacterium]
MECFFCKRNIWEIDYKNEVLLKNFISALGKIRPRKKNGLCAKHQRLLALAIKRGRFLGLLSYTSR